MDWEHAEQAVRLTQANVSIREAALALSSSGESALDWEFFCECGAHDCLRMIMLTVEAYDAIRERGDPLLAPGHQLTEVGRARQARTNAKELQDSAKALQAQARQQAKRARRSLPPT